MEIDDEEKERRNRVSRQRFGMIETNFNYEPKFEKYLLTEADCTDYFERQFFHVYRDRMAALLPEIESAAREDNIINDSSIRIEPLSNTDVDRPALIAGVIIKHMTNQPTVLKGFDEPGEDEEGNEDKAVLPLVDEEDGSLASDTDRLDLEDDQKQLVSLIGKIQHQTYTSGMVIGVWGRKRENSHFLVDRVIFPKLRPYLERPILDNDLYIILASGLSVTCSNLDIINGMASFSNALRHAPFHGNVARIVFAGDLSTTFCECEKCRKVSINNVMPLGTSLDPVKDPKILEVIEAIERNFTHYDIDLMPGANDPASLMLPQQPLPPAITERYVPEDKRQPEDNMAGAEEEEDDDADDDEEMKEVGDENVEVISPATNRHVNTVTNPYCFNVQGFQIHGTSGQNVEGILKRTVRGRSVMEVMEQILRLGHLVPTAPDSIDCYPYSTTSKTSDPFIFEQLPHVFFAGNQRHFSTKTVDFGNDRKVCLVSIPRHTETRSFVAVNLRTLNAFELSMRKE
uniref:DNA polymerase epsilon subunit B n=1 Tax=Panagrellus redivivus TaxID=6233 RepID=A0A7E4W0A5_PANRE